MAYAKVVGQYAEVLGLDVPLPEALDEAILVLDENGEYHCFFYYPFNSWELTYHLSDGSTMEYRNGWLFTPDYQLYDYNTDGGRERLLDDPERAETPVGLFVYLDWPKNPIVYLESTQESFQKQWPMKLKIFALEHNIDNQMLMKKLKIIESAVFAVCAFAFTFGIRTVMVAYSRCRKLKAC